MKTIFRTFPDREQVLSVSFSLPFFLCCNSILIFLIFFIYAKRKHISRVPLFFPPGSLIDLVHQLDWSLLVYTGRAFVSQVCACVPVKVLARNQQHSVITNCRLMPQQRNKISNLYKELSLRSKITTFLFKRTLLSSLLCSYNSLLIQCYTHIISQKTICFKCKLMLTQVLSG